MSGPASWASSTDPGTAARSFPRSGYHSPQWSPDGYSNLHPPPSCRFRSPFHRRNSAPGVGVPDQRCAQTAAYLPLWSSSRSYVQSHPGGRCPGTMYCNNYPYRAPLPAQSCTSGAAFQSPPAHSVWSDPSGGLRGSCLGQNLSWCSPWGWLLQKVTAEDSAMTFSFNYPRFHHTIFQIWSQYWENIHSVDPFH